MQRTPLDSCTSYDPATLKFLTRAFDEAWPSVARGNGGYLSMQAKRERLASIVMELAKDGMRDLEMLKAAALEKFNHSERQAS